MKHLLDNLKYFNLQIYSFPYKDDVYFRNYNSHIFSPNKENVAECYFVKSLISIGKISLRIKKLNDLIN